MESQLFPKQKAPASVPIKEPASAFRYWTYYAGAEGGTRTPTPEGTAPSRQRVYQFHHFRTMCQRSPLPAASSVSGSVDFLRDHRCLFRYRKRNRDRG